MALDFTLLTAEQIWGDKNGNGQLDVLKKYGTKVEPTDLTVLLGSPSQRGSYTCCAWSTSDRQKTDVYCIGYDGAKGWVKPDVHAIPVRPALSPSETAELFPSNRKIDDSGAEIVEYGEYPQMIVNEQVGTQLEEVYQSGSLPLTGKKYTFDSYNPNHYDPRFKKTPYPEYELDGKRYIRVPARPYDNDSRLSTGKRVEKGKPYWVQVQPIEWLKDSSGTWVSQKCLFAGIQFDTNLWYDGDFSKTFMKKYLDIYFAKEMGYGETMAQNRNKVLTGLSSRLEGMTNTETIVAIKEKLKASEKGRKVPTEPKRMEEAARIKQVRQARDIILTTLQEAIKNKDEKLVQEIMKLDIVRYYDSRHQIQQEKVQQRRATRRAKRESR